MSFQRLYLQKSKLETKHRLQLSQQVVKKPFQEPKTMFKLLLLIQVVIVLVPVEKPKIEVHLFDRATFSGFTIRELTRNGCLNMQKYALLPTKIGSGLP